MKKKKKSKFTFSGNHLFLIFVIIAISYNTYIHSTHSAYKYYKDNIRRLEEDLKAYRALINKDILFRLSTLTNFLPSVNRPYQYTQVSSDIKLDPIEVAPSNYPSFKFDAYFESGSKQYARSGFKYYTSGDEINGLPIRSISPQFVQIADRFYPIGATEKEIKK